MVFHWTIRNYIGGMYVGLSNNDALSIVKSKQTALHQYRLQLKQRAEHGIYGLMVHHTVHRYKSKHHGAQ